MSSSVIHLSIDEMGDGPCIVFLHGFPFNRSMWDEQADFLSTHGYRVIAPDLRGLGEASDKVHLATAETNRQAEAHPTTTMDEMARDIAHLMDELKIDRAVICGLSMGCYVAFDFIHLFPERVPALILCGPKADGPDETEKASREALAHRALREGMHFAVESITTKLLARKTVNEKRDVVARVTEMVLSTDPRGAAAAQRGMAARRDYSDDLANIKVPTLIIAGSEDDVRTPEDAEFIHQNIHESQLTMIDDAGHLMNMEQPQIFNRAVLSFLKPIH